MALGVAALLGFYLVDSLFIARLGTAPLAAQAFTLPLTLLMIGLQVGIGIAQAALISRALGAGQTERAKRLSGLILLGGSMTTGLVCVLLWLLHPLLFPLLGADQSLMGLIRPYWAIQVCVLWLSSVIYLGYSLFRAYGNTRVPGMIMLLTSLLNVLLDPLLIFGIGPFPALGLPGAAWASLAAFAISGCVLAWLLAKQHWLTTQGLLTELNVSFRPFSAIAGPAMLSQLMPPLAAMLATAMVASAGTNAVAAWGLITRVEGIMLVVVLAMTMALPPWLGRCYGAGDWPQIRRIMIASGQMIIVIQALLGLLVMLMADPLSRWLVTDPEVQSYLATLLRWMPVSYTLLGICMLVVSASNALGWPLRAMAASFARLFVCYVPLLAVGLWLNGLAGAAIGAAAGNMLAGILAWQLYRHSIKPHGDNDTLQSHSHG